MMSLPFRARATTRVACGVLAIACAGAPVRAQRPAADPAAVAEVRALREARDACAHA